MSKRRYRARFASHSGDFKSPLKKSVTESQVSIVCEWCYHTGLHWYPRIPAGSPPQDCTRVFVCKTPGCGAQLLGYVTPEWREYAELWRPYQHSIDFPHRYRDRNAPPPLPGADTLPPAPPPPDPALIPASIRTHHLDRPVNITHAHYMLTNQTNTDAFVVRVYEGVTNRPYKTARGKLADIALFYPPPGPDRDALRRLYDIPADYETGQIVSLSAVPWGKDTDCWVYAKTATQTHAELEQHADALTPATLQAAEVPEPRALEPDPEPHSAAVEAWLDKHADEVIDAVEVEPDADEEPTVTVAGLADLEGEVLAEWAADDDTQPGIDTETHPCRTCSGEPSSEPHPCPYDEDVNHDGDTLCNCCDICTEECARDI